MSLAPRLKTDPPQLRLVGLLLLCLWGFPWVSVAQGAEQVAIGVLSYRSKAETLAQWEKTALYLSQALPEYRFKIWPLSAAELEEGCRSGVLDLVLTNPAHYISLEVQSGASRIATLQRQEAGAPLGQFGAVIFTAKATKIKSLEELKGRLLVAASPESLGGYLAGLELLVDQELDPAQDLGGLRFTGMPQDLVVTAVLSGSADAGIVRTGVLEKMAQQGRIRLEQVVVLNPQKSAGFPYLLSSPLYSEWPLAKLPRLPMPLAKRILVALLTQETQAPGSLGPEVSGWLPAQNYQEVHRLLKKLQLGPYRQSGEVSLRAFAQTYRWQLVLGLMVLLLVLGFAWKNFLVTLRLKREINRRRKTERNLESAKLDAERANQSKSLFLSNLSHELRTPMNGILGLSLWLKETELDREQRSSLALLTQSAQGLMAVIDELLDFTQLEQGQMVLRPENFDLAKTLNNLKDLYGIEAEAKGLLLTLSLDPKLPVWVRGDKNRLVQALGCLLANALKFTKAGGIKLTAQTQDSGLISLEVADTGIGINKEQQALILAPFAQVDRSATKAQGGVGLGLTLAQRLARLMGGELTLTSPLGQGSRFVLTLPLPAASAPELPQPLEPPNLLGKRLLLVEDNQVNRKVMQKVLEKTQASVQEAVNGQEAVILLQQKPFDLVLMDLQMPVLDGLSAIKLVRSGASQALNPQIPIVALTANSLVDGKKEAFTAGVNDYLSKPVNAQALYEVLRRHLS